MSLIKKHVSSKDYKALEIWGMNEAEKFLNEKKASSINSKDIKRICDYVISAYWQDKKDLKVDTNSFSTHDIDEMKKSIYGGIMEGIAQHEDTIDDTKPEANVIDEMSKNLGKSKK